ncbi:hypothetical protein EUX98_g3998 [Antrodiella citrinella]|uniref:Uncharacterized protein n=1 Tax=Antrodiella citrinella TaxID=2447956 RepID=A0A4S4MV10_9APHY|nr:hypothetical protein EUX98_g3998 [Antrodiella citrinella]
MFNSLLSNLSSLLLLCSYSLVSATLVNITVDDSGADPSNGARIMYAPSSAWSFGQDCTACTARPDPEEAFMETWHDGTFNPQPGSNDDPNMVLRSAIYVFCILAHTFSSPDGNSDMTFLIDGQPVGAFSQSPTGATNYDFNVPVYTNTSIPFGIHTFTLWNGHVNEAKSLVLLDYLIYSTEQDDIVPPLTGNNSSQSAFSFITQTSSGLTSLPMSTSASTSLSSSGTPMSSGTASTLLVPTPTPSTTGQPASDNASTHSSLTSRDRIIIAASSAGGGLLILACIIITLIYCRRRRYSDYTAPDAVATGTGHIVEGASGWVEGTWGPTPDEPIHPSLVAIPAFRDERKTHATHWSNATSNTVFSQRSETNELGVVGPRSGLGSSLQVRTGGDTLVLDIKSPMTPPTPYIKSTANPPHPYTQTPATPPTPIVTDSSATSTRQILSLTSSPASGHRVHESEPDVPSSAVSSPMLSGSFSPSTSTSPYYAFMPPLVPPGTVPPPLTRSESARPAGPVVKFESNRHPDLMRGASASAALSKSSKTQTAVKRVPVPSPNPSQVQLTKQSPSGSDSPPLSGGSTSTRGPSPRGARPMGMYIDAEGMARFDIGENSRPPSYETAKRK